MLNSIHVSGTGLELMPKLNPGKSVVRLAVKKKNAGDDDNDDEECRKLMYRSKLLMRYPFIKRKD